MDKRTLLPFVILVSTLSTCFSQGLPVLVLKGVITNASTGEVISYATVRV